MKMIPKLSQSQSAKTKVGRKICSAYILPKSQTKFQTLVWNIAKSYVPAHKTKKNQIFPNASGGADLGFLP